MSQEEEPQRLAPAPDPPPVDPRNPNDPNRALPPVIPNLTLTPSNERWGRLMLRVGTVQTLQGQKDEALATFRRVLELLPQTASAIEAQYRIGYAYETVADDLDRAGMEYGRVNKLSGSSPFSLQASQRLHNLDRLAQFRSSTGKDSVAKKAEAGFLLAELYLFQNDKPERALTQYDSIVHS